MNDQPCVGSCRYTVEPQTVDVGPVLFDRATERDLSIHNKGRVQFSFEVDTSELSRPSVCDVMPKTGTVMPGQHALVKLKVSHTSDTLLWRPDTCLGFESVVRCWYVCCWAWMAVHTHLNCALLHVMAGGFGVIVVWCLTQIEL